MNQNADEAPMEKNNKYAIHKIIDTTEQPLIGRKELSPP